MHYRRFIQSPYCPTLILPSDNLITIPTLSPSIISSTIVILSQTSGE
jgi:hypothetical protein